jgi:outer membrane protein assembly factor BamC
MKFSVKLLIGLTAINLAACSSGSSIPYNESRVLADLEIPPDLTVETSDTRVELPSAVSADGSVSDGTNNVGGSVSGGTNTSIPVLADTESIKLEGYADFYWLSVQGSVENTYQLVRKFWASEGYKLILDEPVIGIMQTEWIYHKVGTSDDDENFISRFFGGDELSGTQDQFKTRIARDPETGATQVYITHRGTEYTHVLSTKADNEKNDSNAWGFRASDSELEVEMLSRLMVFLGLERSELDEHLVNIKLFAPRSRLEVDYKENETYLLLKGDYTRNWNRTLHQLERLSFEVVKSEIRSGFSGDGVMHVKTDIDTKVQKTGLFSISSEVEIQKKELVLIFSEESHELTRISMEDEEGEIDNSPEAVEFLTLLNQYLR